MSACRPRRFAHVLAPSRRSSLYEPRRAMDPRHANESESLVSRLDRPATRLQRFERSTDWPLAAVALAILALYSVQVLAQPRGHLGRAIGLALLALYFVFVVDYLARLYLAEPRAQMVLPGTCSISRSSLLPFLRPLRLLSLAVVVECCSVRSAIPSAAEVIVYTVCGPWCMIYAGVAGDA